MSDNTREDEPLLGRPGDATQADDRSLWYNLVIGTGVLAQLGIWILFGIVWGQVFSAKNLILFSAHPLLNSFGLLLLTQAILIVQPTRTQSQKIHGTYLHSALNGFGLAGLFAGLVIIEYNKFAHHGEHFQSLHGILGLITYLVFALQATVGAAAFYTPQIFGSVQRGKSLYKYHRASGYLILVLSFVTVAAATTTDFNHTTLHIRLWAVIVAAVITLLGVLPRIRKSKFGF